MCDKGSQPISHQTFWNTIPVVLETLARNLALALGLPSIQACPYSIFLDPGLGLFSRNRDYRICGLLFFLLLDTVNDELLADLNYNLKSVDFGKGVKSSIQDFANVEHFLVRRT